MQAVMILLPHVQHLSDADYPSDIMTALSWLLIGLTPILATFALGHYKDHPRP